MKITIFGAGATGGNFAIRLAQAGHKVSLVARGAHLEAMRSRGLTLKSGDETTTLRLPASDDAGAFGPQEVVYTGVKATGLAAIAAPMRPLVGPDTLVVFPQNGIPWWYPLGLKDKPAAPDLPQFRLARAFDYITPEQIVGGSIYSGNEVSKPGTVLNTSPGINRLDLGAITDTREPGALTAFRAACNAAGILSPDCTDIRHISWRKLLFNVSGSILALITRNQSSIVRHDAALEQVYRQIVAEGLAIARAAGYDLTTEVNVDRMISLIPDHYPSILQDYLAKRPMEIGEIMLSPLAFARKAGLATPILDTLAALAQRIAEDAGLFTREG